MVDEGTLRLLKQLRPDALFRQSQWDADVPSPLATDRLGFTRLCLMPYETVNIIRNVPAAGDPDGAFDSPYHRAAWLVFCANDQARELARDAGPRRAENYRVVGHPKADRLRSAEPRWPLETGAGRPRVVWSAHHSIGTGWTDVGMFHLTAHDMLAWAEDDPELDFVFMPHPALLPYLDSPRSPIDSAWYAEWSERWQALPNATILDDQDYIPVLAASDLMVTDGLSMLVEYQVLGKPLIYLEREGHRPFNRIGEQLASGWRPAGTVAEARELARPLLGNDNPLREAQLANAQRLFGPADGPGAAARVLEAILAETCHRRDG